MGDVKVKAKQFWEEHKGSIIAVGISSIAVGYLAFAKGYVAGYVDGGMSGFHLTLDWLDKTFPNESKARELYNNFSELHPEEIVYKKGLGKWS